MRADYDSRYVHGVGQEEAKPVLIDNKGVKNQEGYLGFLLSSV
jgi:hypothetical protein